MRNKFSKRERHGKIGQTGVGKVNILGVWNLG